MNDILPFKPWTPRITGSSLGIDVAIRSAHLNAYYDSLDFSTSSTKHYFISIGKSDHLLQILSGAQAPRFRLDQIRPTHPDVLWDHGKGPRKPRTGSHLPFSSLDRPTRPGLDVKGWVDVPQTRAPVARGQDLANRGVTA